MLFRSVSWDDLSGRIRETAGDYALQLYRQMLVMLTSEYLVHTEDGYEIGNSNDTSHILPFDFPISRTP